MDESTKRLENLSARVSKLEDRQERLFQVQEMIAQSHANLTNVVQRMTDAQMQLTQIAERFEARLSSTTAAVERLDRIIDYLIRRDGERPESDRHNDDSSADFS